MLFKLLVKREEDVTKVKIATGFPETFERNEHGDMVADVCNGENVAYMRQSSSFEEYHGPAEPVAELEPDPLSDDERFVKEWCKIRKDKFVSSYVPENLERFDAVNDDILNMAVKKWWKSTSEPWPGRLPEQEIQR